MMQDIDHRTLGSRLELFHQQEEGPGMVFWHPRGCQLYRTIEDYVRAQMRGAGFHEVRTPQLLSRALWERSGHWDKFGGSIYSIVDASNKRPFCLKPMNCPCHIQLFNKRTRSYHDLPVRYSEFGMCHRDEPAGSLQGLMRTRAFVQDDAHVFCAENQSKAEIGRFCNLLRTVYQAFGFCDFKVAFSTRPVSRAGSDEIWDRAERGLADAAAAAGLKFEVQTGEGAFYGPKLEFHLTDSRDRSWQCGTVQLDYLLPQRLDASFVNNQGLRETPVMIHHAILGSMERFIGILLEHYEGWLPTWLAPDQVIVSTVTNANVVYANRVMHALGAIGVRAILDSRAERLNRKIVDARERCIPIFATVGPRDELDETIALRWKDGAQKTFKLADAIAYLQKESSPPISEVEKT
jgi:threonyl-tRNA synthetase